MRRDSHVFLFKLFLPELLSPLRFFDQFSGLLFVFAGTLILVMDGNLLTIEFNPVLLYLISIDLLFCSTVYDICRAGDMTHVLLLL